VRPRWRALAAELVDNTRGRAIRFATEHGRKPCLASALITPVPGGVGPTTIAVLLAQTIDAANNRTT
jgi:5,10-methylene-tetrahydrofolate dehydrogenase/methenyl tetrahydrofolate cyclohydrolase